MRKFLSILVLITASPAIAGPYQFMSQFEEFCLGSPGQATSELTAIGARRLNEVEASAFLSPLKGAAWALPQNSLLSIVSLLENGSCGIFEASTKADEIEDLIKTRYSSRLIYNDHEGVDDTDFFAMTFRERHYFVSVKKPAESGKETGLTVMAVPSSLLPGVQLQWP